MPLPANGTPWPPAELRKITQQMRTWDAWYTGDTVRLAEVYGYIGAGIPGYPAPNAAVYRPGVFGAIARWFWGQPMHGQQLNKLHIPIAGDICSGSADLLFAEPPTLTVDKSAKGTQDRLDELADDTMHGVLAEAVEIGAALGGSYLRVSWDKATVPDKPFLTAVHADAALPEFRYGRLAAVTFWTVVRREGQQVWRHLERHELDSQGVGLIQHALYKGSEASLGMAVPLTDITETTPLAQPGVLDQNSTISTESPGLGCVYIPNQRPQRRWRNDPAGASLGRSDLDGVEHMMDALDETWTSWMRDIRLGKARVFVAESVMRDHGAGHGASFDMDQEVFSPLNVLATGVGNSGGGLPIQAEQFAIRVAEHSTTADKLIGNILRTAGYSSQTFGMEDATGKVSNLTATEVQARERRSYMTRDRKIRLTGPQVAAICQKLLAVDKAIFNTQGTDVALLPQVTFADSAQESVITLAQTAQALATARAASTQTLVSLVNPSWGDDEVQAEVLRIQAEDQAANPPLPDPATFTGTDPNLNPNDPASFQQ